MNKAILGNTKAVLNKFDPNIEGHLKIENIVVHPNYVKLKLENDIALYGLESIVKFTDYIRPICLNVDPTLNVDEATACGWGATENKGKSKF